MKLWIKLNAGYSEYLNISTKDVRCPGCNNLSHSGIVKMTVICYHFIYSSQVAEKNGRILRQKLRIRTPADVWRKIWGLIYIIVFQIFSLHLMSNALSNCKISENYKKSNLTRKDSGELCRLWMHLSCVGKFWWLLIMICVMIQWFVVLFSFYYELPLQSHMFIWIKRNAAQGIIPQCWDIGIWFWIRGRYITDT